MGVTRAAIHGPSQEAGGYPGRTIRCGEKVPGYPEVPDTLVIYRERQ